ncbi:MAG: DMT family transporter [Saprospiraceae bacterium]|nr:DMT family transporter [Saprospiraceae bacterium]
MSNNSLGIIFAIVGSLLFSTKAVFVKLAYQYEVDSISLLLLRMVFALPFYLFMILQVGSTGWNKWRGISTWHWLGLVLSAVLGYYLSSLLDFMGLKYISASVERLILFIYPTFIAIISFFVFKERITLKQGAALALSYLGLVFVFGHNLTEFSLDSTFWKGAFLILGCAVTFAIFLVLSQAMIPVFGATSFTSLSMSLACFIVIVHFLSVHQIQGLGSLDLPVYLYALAMATLATVIPSYVVNYAIQRIGATKAAILASVGPVSTIALAYWLLDERLFPGQFIGAGFIIVGVTIVSVEMRKRKK